MHPKKILVTGGCGYIGSHVTRQLSEAGYSVVVIDNLSTGSRGALIHGEELVVADLGDEVALGALFSRHGSFSACLHFAGSIVVPDSVADPLGYYENNTVGTLRLLKACVKYDVPHFVFSSTASIYGETSHELLSEETPIGPTNPYARSKLMDEWILADVAKISSLRYVVLRYFNVAGADLKGRMGQRSVKATHLVKVASEAVVGKRKEVVIFGTDYPTPDGTGIRDYIHVEDLASAHLSALGYLERGGASVTLNCGYGRGYSVRQVLDEARRLGGEFRVSIGPRRAGDVAWLVADVRRIHEVLDWEPRHAELSEVVATAIAFERKLLGGG